VNALGINYAQSSGNRQALYEKTLTKRIQPALAARAAMFAVALAERGFTGPRKALEGEAGYFRVYLNGKVCEPENLTREYDWFQIERLVVKHYTSCGGCHSVQSAAERIVREENLKPDDIDRVELYGCGPGGMVGCPFEIGENPQVDAQFNAAYGVALTLLRGPAKLSDFTNKAVCDDTEVAELAKKITYVTKVDDLPEEIEIPIDYPLYNSRYHAVIVYTKDGRRMMRAECPAQTFAPGADTFETVIPKFRDCAEFAGVFDEGRTETIIEAVLGLDDTPNIETLLTLMCE
jgi:2-methylcitrate dehydratase PrpD